MMEGAIMEYVKWFIGIMSGFFTLLLVIFLFQLNEINTFQQEVNYQIERHGGLTTEAKSDLSRYAETQHNGYVSFSLENNKPSPGVHNVVDGKVVDSSGEVLAFSGFSLVEVEADANSSDLVVYHRGSDADDQERYGEPIMYALKRHVGSIGDFTLEPVVMGESASRVRGTNNVGRQ